jgi:hypothetical protein
MLLYSRRDPALDSSYLRLGCVFSAIPSIIIHLITEGRMPRCVNILLSEVAEFFESLSIRSYSIVLKIVLATPRT